MAPRGRKAQKHSEPEFIESYEKNRFLILPG